MENRELQIKALGDETRLNIVKLLLRHRLCVKALAKRSNISEAAVSQHLGILFNAGLLSKEKHGYYVHYEVNRNELSAIATYFTELAEVLREDCDKECCHKEGVTSGHCNCKKS